MQKKFLFSLVLFLFSHVSATTADMAAFYEPYSQLLGRYLQEGAEKEGVVFTAVDYAAWSQDPLHSQAMDALRAIEPAALEGADQMAYWINAYNLLTIDLIIRSAEKESIRNLGGPIVGVWRKHSWRLFDRDYSLHRIEHGILRWMGDSRFHFAINCASLSCPDLRATPYSGEELEQQLQEQTAAFIQNPTKGFAAADGYIDLSPLFKWYSHDFGGKKGVAAFIKEWTGVEFKEAKDVRFMRYDWSLNGDW